MGILDFIFFMTFLGIVSVVFYFIVKFYIKEVNQRTALLKELYIFLKNKNNKEI